MDLTTLLPQLGLGGIFAVAAVKLYNDMRQDSLRREEQIMADSKAREEQIRADSKAREEKILSDSKEREEKLVAHLDKVADTLENINERLVKVELNVCVKKGEE